MARMSHFEVREGEPEDARALHALHVEALRNHPEAFAAGAEETAAQERPWKGRFRRYHRQGLGAICLAASGERLVGMSGVYRRDLARARHIATVWGMYVRPAWRGRGVASELLAANIRWARANHVRIVRLAVSVANGRAIRCYHNAGFTVYGVEPDALHHDGVYYDELLMAYRVN